MANLINLERATVSFGTRTLLDGVSLGVDEGDAIGVVGRNGDGKTTLLQVLTGTRQPDSGRVTHTSGSSVGYLRQSDDFAADATVRDVIVGGQPDHIWAADADTRAVVSHLLGGLDLDSEVGNLSGGERRRVALAAVLLAGHDVLVLDEPTNHLDVEVIGWLAGHLAALRTKALVVVSHDRWFLDAVCTRTWEVHDGSVDAYEGGYAAYVLARAERMRVAAGTEARRRNLMRKELAWLRRGPPARTSKPKFRIQAANELIANEPEPRDALALQRFATRALARTCSTFAACSSRSASRINPRVAPLLPAAINPRVAPLLPAAINPRVAPLLPAGRSSTGSTGRSGPAPGSASSA